ncbi:SusC/RagA family TonB-linked outer membrane protein [Parasediminibacterium sp. JCM 36343]|uniref:SusC/RagA family TonB-linked outer membrane protein n=1 Tax=Parasediminibacterium sp. JCM 36343 TaxID=3374279 RepID=UPI00397AEA39
MKKGLLFCLCCMLSIASLLAQSREVKGTVLDEKGMPLPKASVVFKGAKGGVSTDEKGNFVLKIPITKDSGYLVISYVNYKTKLVPFAVSKTVTVKLELDFSATPDEVVVIGYQSVRRKDIQGAVSSVNAKQLKDVVVNSAEEALTGRLAGVQVTGSEGGPNAQMLIKVRGGGSVTQDNVPLYIIDGIEVDDGLSKLGPQDIETIDVLKDAAATSIYGARGANGVVVITTKGGKNTQGKMNVSYNFFTGINKLPKELEVMKPYDFMLYLYERSLYTGDTVKGGINLYAPWSSAWDTVQAYKNRPFYDWQKKMLGHNAMQQTHNISISGGTAQTTYYLSFTANKQDGLFLNSGYDRKLVTFKFDHKASEKLKIGVNIRYNNNAVKGPNTSDQGSSSLNFMRQIIRYKPFLGAGQTDNSSDQALEDATSSNGLSLINPVLLNNAMYRNNVTNNYNLGGYLNYTFDPHFSFRATFGFDNNTLRQDAFDDTITYLAKRSGAGKPAVTIGNDNRVIFNNSNVLTFTTKTKWFKHDNDITLLAGEEWYMNTDKQNNSQIFYFPIGITAAQALGNLNLAHTPQYYSQPLQTSSILPLRISSFFGKLNYTLDKKYVFTASLRKDGSSVFGPAHRWGIFPSASLSWRVSQESFMDKYKSTISDMKLRASYGIVGNSRIPPYQYDVYYTSTNPASAYALSQTIVPGINVPSPANPNLQWEPTTSRDLGLDLSLFKDRLSITIDGYYNTTNKLLINTPIQQSSGYETQYQNIGVTLNKGVELQLSGTVLRTRNFTWTATYNISANSNTIKSLGAQNAYLFNSGWAGTSNLPDFEVKVGQSVGSMYGFVNDGFYHASDFDVTPKSGPGPYVYNLKKSVANDSSITSAITQPGSIKYKDLNGDGVVDANDRTIIGNALPKFFGGLNQQFSYKGFDASIFINYSYGSKVFNYNRLEFTSGYTPGANMLAVANNRWRVTDNNGNIYQQISNKQVVVSVLPSQLDSLNKNASFWLPLVGSSSSSFSPNSWSVEDGSFIRISNITFGYSLPASLMRRAKITKLRFYLTVNNVAVITGYSGYDPEVNTRRATPLTPSVDYSAYPRSRAYICGLNLTF